MTIREVLINIRERLQNAGIEDFEYESWAFLDWKLHIDRAEFYMNPNGEVKEELLAELESVLKQREQRVPLQYLMGECEFMGYDFYVDERVLIPRQDTECLVELAVEDIRNRKTQNRCESNNTADQKNEQKVKVLDLCTGSGCIGISVAKLCPDTEVTLADISEGALSVAKECTEPGCRCYLNQRQSFRKYRRQIRLHFIESTVYPIRSNRRLDARSKRTRTATRP